ncbi:MAG: hypothetical protein MOP51_1261, partial [Citricoccus sp.]|nr:hypothetical protein [Citricoccus sp. WCRC_4]
DLKTLAGTRVNGQEHEHFWGSTLAGPQWMEFMEQASGSVEAEPFRAPEDSPFEDPGSTGRYRMGGNGTG